MHILLCLAATTSIKKEIIRYRRKPKRPCPYCEKQQCKLTRHLKHKHKKEENVKLALSKPKKEQNAIFELLRKEGIYNYNMRMLKEGTSLLKERDQGNHDLQICDRAFISRTFFIGHRKSCQLNHSLLQQVKPELVVDKNDFFTDKLGRLKDNDAIGELCESDYLIQTVGMNRSLKHYRLKNKETEIRNYVMSDMRLLATLLIAFRNSTSDNTLQGIDMFDRKNFAKLENAIEQVTFMEDGSLKTGLKKGDLLYRRTG